MEKYSQYYETCTDGGRRVISWWGLGTSPGALGVGFDCKQIHASGKGSGERFRNRQRYQVEASSHRRGCRLDSRSGGEGWSGISVARGISGRPSYPRQDPTARASKVGERFGCRGWRKNPSLQLGIQPGRGAFGYSTSALCFGDAANTGLRWQRVFAVIRQKQRLFSNLCIRTRHTLHWSSWIVFTIVQISSLSQSVTLFFLQSDEEKELLREALRGDP